MPASTDVDQDLVDGRARRSRGGRRLADAPVARDLHRLWPGQRLRAGRVARDSTSRTRTPRPTRLPLNSLGALGGLDGRPARGRLERARRTDRVRSSTPATSTSSWARRPGEPRSRSGSSSTASPRGDAHGTRRRRPTAPGSSTDQRTYQLIRQRGAIADRRFEIEFLEAGRRGLLLHVRLRRRRVSGRPHGGPICCCRSISGCWLTWMKPSRGRSRSTTIAITAPRAITSTTALSRLRRFVRPAL